MHCLTMFRKAVLVILCLMTHHECGVIQPISQRNDLESFTQLISDSIESITAKCSIHISNNTLDFCRRPLSPLGSKGTTDYFNYDQALCIALYDSVECLCNLKKLTKSQLEESNPLAKNSSAVCIKMRSALNYSLFDTKVSERTEWIIALKDRLNDDGMCKDACIQTGGELNPLCSTFLQINAILISNLPEKPTTSGTSGVAVTTSADIKEHVQAASKVNKAANNVNKVGTHTEPEDTSEKKSLPIQKDQEPEDISEKKSIHVQKDHGLKDQQTQVSIVEEGDHTQGSPLTESSHRETLVKTVPTASTISKTENNDKARKKEDAKIPAKEISPENEHTPINKKQHITTNTVKDNVNKQISNTQETNNDQVTNKPHSSSALENNEESKVNVPQSTNRDETNEEPASNKLPAVIKENDKDPEKNKQSPITGETNKKTDKPSTKPEDDKETNMDKPPVETKGSDKVQPEPVLEMSKNKNSDIRTEVSQVSKTRISDKPKDTDMSTKEISVPKTEDVLEPAQAQSPDIESDITDKDQTILDGNTFNEDTGEQTIGENQEIDVDGPNNLGTDDDDDGDGDVGGGDIKTPKINTLPKMDESKMSSPMKGTYDGNPFIDAKDSHFFAYFMTMVIICIIGYLVYHNKQKILALALEGRSRRSTRRRPNTSGYRKLDSNLEEAVTSACSTSVTHVIY